MAVVSMRELLEAGVHFGHQTRRWNPKMRRFIFTERGGIYIIDLTQTSERLDEAAAFVRNLAERNGTVLFVGTKKQAQDAVESEAKRVGMPYVNHRWLGGLLTNWRTMSDRIERLHEMRRLNDEGQIDLLPAKERISMSGELEKLEANLGGVADMRRQPDAVFIVDLRKEQLAVREARRLGLPVIALVDTNCDPDEADFVIPGNDDAIRSCSLIARAIADGIAAGQQKVTGRDGRRSRAGRSPTRRQEAEPPAEEPRRQRLPRPQRPQPRPDETATRPPSRGRARRGRAARCRAAPEVEAVMSGEISAALVKELRERTGAGMMDCKRALQETNGDMDAAIKHPPRAGHGAGREARRPRDDRGQGRLPPRRRRHEGTMVAVGCETEPVSNNDEFLAYAKKVLDAVDADGDRRRVELEEERVALVREARREHRRRRRRALRGGRRRGSSRRTRIRLRTSSARSCRCAAATTISAARSRCTSPRRSPRWIGREDVPEDAVDGRARDLRELRRGAVEAGAGAREDRRGMLEQALLRRERPRRPGLDPRHGEDGRPGAEGSRRRGARVRALRARQLSTVTDPRGGRSVAPEAATPASGACC